MARARVVVEFADRPDYEVRIGAGVHASLPADLRAAGADAGRCLIICDPDAQTRCLPSLRAAFSAAGVSASGIAVPAAEPRRAWDVVAELHRALDALALPDAAPVVVCAGAESSALASFAVRTYGQDLRLVPVPASIAAALATVGVDRLEVDAGHPVPLVAPAAPAFACIDIDFLACASDEEEALGLDELALGRADCDEDYGRWYDVNAAAIAAHDGDALALALAQEIAARADLLGQAIAGRIRS